MPPLSKAQPWAPGTRPSSPSSKTTNHKEIDLTVSVHRQQPQLNHNRFVADERSKHRPSFKRQPSRLLAPCRIPSVTKFYFPESVGDFSGTAVATCPRQQQVKTGCEITTPQVIRRKRAKEQHRPGLPPREASFKLPSPQSKTREKVSVSGLLQRSHRMQNTIPQTTSPSKTLSERRSSHQMTLPADFVWDEGSLQSFHLEGPAPPMIDAPKPHPDSPQATRPAPPDAVQMEIAPGVSSHLRGSQETLNAMQQGFTVELTCFCCTASFLCIADAEFVLCPCCKVVGPAAGDIGGGIGLGVIQE